MVHSFVLDLTNEDLSTSPIFSCRQLTVQQSSVSAHAAVTFGSISQSQNTSSNCSSSAASPWLSKDRGLSRSNGKTAVKTTARSGYERHLANFVLIMLPQVIIRNFSAKH